MERTCRETEHPSLAELADQKTWPTLHQDAVPVCRQSGNLPCSTVLAGY